MADCTILLRTTLYDGDAVSVREALWIGTPVIASDNGMRPEGVRLVPKEDAAYYESEVKAGRTIVTVTSNRCEEARRILQNNGGTSRAAAAT